MSPWAPDPVEVIGDLIEFIDGLDIPNGMKNSLTSQLEAAENALSNDQEDAAINILNAFINHVNGLGNAGKLTQEEVDYLVSAAQEIIDIIEG
jgi:hypothetical protein